jgi:AAA15 family ATPase/GTPase
MLIEFTVENFLSFKSKQTFTMQATALKELTSSNVFLTDVSDLSLLKSAAIYGANASGKSNFFKALQFVVTFMRSSTRATQIGDNIGITPFKLSTETANKPSVFEIQILIGDTAYKFGFTITDEKVLSEYLYQRKKHKEYLLFKRTNQEFEIDDKFTEGNEIEQRTRPNALFLTTVAQFNGPISAAIISSLKKWKFMTDDLKHHINKTAALLDSSPIIDKLKNFILTYDLGFNDIKTTKKEIEYKNRRFYNAGSIFFSDKKYFQIEIQTGHKIFDENKIPIEEIYFDLNEESEGTKKFFGLAGTLIEALTNGGVIIIDEFTSRLHPFLAEFIVKAIHSNIVNPLNAQLIFISHSTFLLRPEIFRRDQVYLFKKENEDYSSITPISNLDVRKDASYEGKYFNENFGYTPKKRNPNQLTPFADL